MANDVVRPAYGDWPRYQRRLVDVVADLTDDQLGLRPTPDRWPIWASIGHLACQRVFWLCDVAGAPGAESTPFPRAATDCPGDDDLEHVLDARALVAALESTFRIVEDCLDHWTVTDLAEVVHHPGWPGDRQHSRGFALARVFSHDVAHIAELNEVLAREGLLIVDLWD